MKLNVTAILEMGKDGKFTCFVTENLGTYAIAGFGNTADEAREDMLECYQEMKEINAERGIETPEFEFTYKYDIQSFFDKFNFLNISKVASIAGVNASLMRQYAKGLTNASETQYKKLAFAVNKIANELSSVTF